MAKNIVAFILFSLILVGCARSPAENKGPLKGEQSRPFSSAELARADEALAYGARIEDPQDDFYILPEGTMQGDGRPDNTNPYPIGDLKAFTIAADEDYLYVKFEFYDRFPEKMPVYDGDPIWSVGAKMDQIMFYRDGEADLAEMGIDLMYSFDHPTLEDTEVEPLEKPMLGQQLLLTPLGFDKTSETIYKTNTGAGLVAGGAGANYMLSAVPLSVFGMKPGDEIILGAAMESGSGKYHHASIDFLLDVEGQKTGDRIRYRLGSSEYERMGLSEYENLPDKVKIDDMIRGNTVAITDKK